MKQRGRVFTFWQLDTLPSCFSGYYIVWFCLAPDVEAIFAGSHAYHSFLAKPILLHVYLDRESQHRLMPCMRMKTCMKMVVVSAYASGPG